jgi:DNA-binding LytR/AlgR family response regulator
MLQIAFCDDNIDELSNMVQLLNLYRASKNFNCGYAVFPNGFDLVSALEKGKRFDIYCLDIIMPGFTGMDVAKAIREYDKTAPILYHLRSGKVIKCTEPFSSVCDTFLKYGCFIKPHRSYLVNMQYVDTIQNHQMTLQTLSTVPIAQGKAKEIKQQYLNYQMEGE